MSSNPTMSTTGVFEGRKERSALPTELAAGIIHDLGNLIQIASSAVNIIARNPSIHTTATDSVIAGAKASLARAGALVRQTISTATERALPTAEVSVTTCLAEVEALVRSTWDDDVRLDIQVDSDLPAIQCDALGLQNAVLNLLFNARDAMPNGGSISIRAETTPHGAGEGVELVVTDSGVGMTPDTIARAFEPFFTTKCDGLGGVGLPMVRHFVEELGGRVLIESEYGIGTAVKLQLPAASYSRNATLRQERLTRAPTAPPEAS